MSTKQITFIEIVQEFITFSESCMKYACFTRSKNMQETKSLECDDFIELIKAYKYQAIEKKQETYANEFFHLQCVINSVRSYLLMWVELKNNNFNSAWIHLVDAQEYISVALKIRKIRGASALKRKLKKAEDTLFPGWAFFNSPGFIETIGQCSICELPFFECNHIENEIYTGRLCRRINRKILDCDHFALVKKPRDKRCIFTTLSDDEDNELDYFTLEKTGKKNNSTEGKEYTVALFNFKTLDFD